MCANPRVSYILLAVFSRNALYKSTFYLLFLLTYYPFLCERRSDLVIYCPVK